jgi:hypothetical protein
MHFQFHLVPRIYVSLRFSSGGNTLCCKSKRRQQENNISQCNVVYAINNGNGSAAFSYYIHLRSGKRLFLCAYVAALNQPVRAAFNKIVHFLLHHDVLNNKFCMKRAQHSLKYCIMK